MLAIQSHKSMNNRGIINLAVKLFPEQEEFELLTNECLVIWCK